MEQHALLALVRDALHAAYQMGVEGNRPALRHLDGVLHRQLLERVGADAGEEAAPAVEALRDEFYHLHGEHAFPHELRAFMGKVWRALNGDSGVAARPQCMRCKVRHIMVLDVCAQCHEELGAAYARDVAGKGEAERGLSASQRPESADATGGAVAGEASPPAIPGSGVAARIDALTDDDCMGILFETQGVGFMQDDPVNKLRAALRARLLREEPR